MKKDRSKDNVELLGKYLRDRKASHEEEQRVLDRVWNDLRSEGDHVPEKVLRHFRPASTVAAAALVFAVVLSGVLLRSESPASVDSVDGTLDRIYGKGSEPIRVGDKLAFGEVVRSGIGTSAVLTLNDGTEIEMRSTSELALEKSDDGLRIRLNGGGVLVSAAKQRTGHLYVQTKDVTVSVVGTVFLVNAEEAGSRVAVIQGEVHVQQGTELKTLLPGEQVATNPLMESHPVVEQVAWSRGAEAHLALLQQQPKRLEFDAASLRPVESGLARLVTRVRCRGIDGELRPIAANAPPVPQGRCVGDNIPLMSLIGAAYDIEDLRISGLPAPTEHPTYRMDAKAEDPSKATREDLRRMLQNLLSDRLKLRVHRETREMEGYVLLISKDGIKFKEAFGDEEMPQWRSAGPPRLDGGQALPTITRGKFGLKRFAESLSLTANLPIIDKTGLPGLHEISLTIDLILHNFATAGVGVRGGGTPGPQEFDPPLPKALEEQLGLRLERSKVPVEYLVVDHIENATEN